MDLSSVLAKIPQDVLTAYDFSEAVYTRALTPITNIKCPTHGVFEQYSARLRKGGGCPKCGALSRWKGRQLTMEGLIKKLEQVHKGFYRYEHLRGSRFQGMNAYITVECPDHGLFEVNTNHHYYRKQGCPHCAHVKRKHPPINLEARVKTAETKMAKYGELVVSRAKAVHGNKYDYTQVEYRGMTEKVNIICPQHGGFLQGLGHHIYNKQGCPKCTTKSQQEDAIYKFMSIFTKAEARNRTLVAPKELDIYLPEHNLAIEYCGMYWHSHTDKEDEKANKHKHYDKYKAAQTQGVRVITMYESEWLERSHVLKRLLRAAIGKMKGRIMARKCEVRKVGPKEAKAFFEKYHPQGGAGGGSNYALFYKEKMVACMRFSFGINDRGVGAKNSTWTLSRYATRLPVAGGASKLFKAFLKEETPSEVKSFSDNRYFSGAMYQALGFSLDQETLPDYQVWSKTLGLKPKSHYQRRALPQRIIEHQVPIGFDPAHSPQTEQDITYAVGARRIYDCGKKKWVFIDKPTG